MSYRSWWYASEDDPKPGYCNYWDDSDIDDVSEQDEERRLEEDGYYDQ